MTNTLDPLLDEDEDFEHEARPTPNMPGWPVEEPISNSGAFLPQHALPYEDPIDLSFPLHFDNSAELIGYNGGSASDPVEIAIVELEKGFSKLIDDYNVLLDASIGLSYAVTGSARAINPYSPTTTPLFFVVHLSAAEHSFVTFSGTTPIELAIQGCEKDLRFSTWNSASCDWENVLRGNRLPYESPLDQTIPLHFDSSVKLITCEDTVEEQAALGAFWGDLDEWKNKNGMSFDAILEFSYVIAARPTPDGREPEPSPVFIRIGLNSPTEIEKIPLVHGKIKEIMEKHCQNVPGLNLVNRYSVTLPDE
ncbi:hypothetical protein HII31_06683 [Pseudocercospora fuligena]|uniref:Uncharacterized protein n=1 Tax=Pseudocercospora fuligena TaxID=685502 RepID=A0A8H6RJK0_9PEZI|nr:hypothetical protein HII31_06683 [Pseudocercospora fuligena]